MTVDGCRRVVIDVPLDVEHTNYISEEPELRAYFAPDEVVLGNDVIFDRRFPLAFVNAAKHRIIQDPYIPTALIRYLLASDNVQVGIYNVYSTGASERGGFAPAFVSRTQDGKWRIDSTKEVLNRNMADWNEMFHATPQFQTALLELFRSLSDNELRAIRYASLNTVDKYHERIATVLPLLKDPKYTAKQTALYRATGVWLVNLEHVFGKTPTQSSFL